jgi:hypothetical protein
MAVARVNHHRHVSLTDVYVLVLEQNVSHIIKGAGWLEAGSFGCNCNV